ncbi:glutamate--cysteine ligase [Actinomadura sp. HBU206391]|nr:glutamate--cysteine ligase [Actinomadura sp. HBU206391]
MGVEEEFLLVDPVSRRTVAKAAEVLEQARVTSDGAALHQELLATQVEAATGVCTDLAELRRQVVAGRLGLADAAGREGARLVSSGHSVLSEPPVPLTAGERFAMIAEAYAGMVTTYEACGCHVHVGVADRDTAVAVVNHLRPWLPTLLALSANSPFERGSDTGYASWRMLEQARFPGSGIPPWFASAAAHDGQLERLVECGVLMDTAMTFWLARPSPRLPTVEVRAADAAATVDEAILQAALVRGLVGRALSELAAGREAPVLDDQVCATAVWSAARYGLNGPGVDPASWHRLPATRALWRLVEWVGPALEETADLKTVRALVNRIVRQGTGAERQRQAAASGPEGVVDMLIDQTVAVGDQVLPEEIPGMGQL